MAFARPFRFCLAASLLATAALVPAIPDAVAPDGKRYSDIENAFLYRQRLVPQCTCNGKDAFGLAAIGVADDPTLRPGDMVATQRGLMAFTGARSRDGEARNFTPVEHYA